ncbi:MAG: hypothetical protein LBE09_09590 [Christensenellaceae bacterium]|jgi:hypothetical protein|nr:hypothetical protein [Christensenellaceae bacterium]
MKKKVNIVRILKSVITIALIVFVLYTLFKIIQLKITYNATKDKSVYYALNIMKIKSASSAIVYIALVATIDFCRLLYVTKSKTMRVLCLIVIPLDLIIAAVLTMLFFVKAADNDFYPWLYGMCAVYAILTGIVRSNLYERYDIEKKSTASADANST